MRHKGLQSKMGKRRGSKTRERKRSGVERGDKEDGGKRLGEEKNEEV